MSDARRAKQLMIAGSGGTLGGTFTRTVQVALTAEEIRLNRFSTVPFTRSSRSVAGVGRASAMQRC